MAFNLSSLFSKGAGSGTPSTLIPGLKSGKTRQYMVVGALLVALYLGLYLIFATSTEKPKQQVVDQQKVLTTHIAAAGEPVDLRITMPVWHTRSRPPRTCSRGSMPLSRKYAPRQAMLRRRRFPRSRQANRRRPPPR